VQIVSTIAIAVTAISALAFSLFELLSSVRILKKKGNLAIDIRNTHGSPVRVDLDSNDEESIRRVVKSLDVGDE
jgi:hypothetical protein